MSREDMLEAALRRVAARTRDPDTLAIIELALDPKQRGLRRAMDGLSAGDEE